MMLSVVARPWLVFRAVLEPGASLLSPDEGGMCVCVCVGVGGGSRGRYLKHSA